MYFFVSATFFMLNMTIMNMWTIIIHDACKKMLDAILCDFENPFTKRLVNSTFWLINEKNSLFLALKSPASIVKMPVIAGSRPLF